MDDKDESLDSLYKAYLAVLKGVILKLENAEDITLCKRWVDAFNKCHSSQKLSRNCMVSLMFQQLERDGRLTAPFTDITNIYRDFREILTLCMSNSQSDSPDFTEESQITDYDMKSTSRTSFQLDLNTIPGMDHPYVHPDDLTNYILQIKKDNDDLQNQLREIYKERNILIMRIERKDEETKQLSNMNGRPTDADEVDESNGININRGPSETVVPVTSSKIDMNKRPSEVQEASSKRSSNNADPRNSSKLVEGDSKISNPRNSKISDPRNSKISDPRNSKISDPRNSKISTPRNSKISDPRNSKISTPRNSKISDPRNSKIPVPENFSSSEPGTSKNAELSRLSAMKNRENSEIFQNEKNSKQEDECTDDKTSLNITEDELFIYLNNLISKLKYVVSVTNPLDHIDQHEANFLKEIIIKSEDENLTSTLSIYEDNISCALKEWSKKIRNFYENLKSCIDFQNAEVQTERIPQFSDIQNENATQTESCESLKSGSDVKSHLDSRKTNYLRKYVRKLQKSHIKLKEYYEMKLKEKNFQSLIQSKMMKLEVASMKSTFFLNCSCSNQMELSQLTNYLEQKYKEIVEETITNMKNEFG